MVVPFGPGTTTDTVGRVVADALGKRLHQSVIVDNRAGAGGVTGSDMVAKSAADGRTLVMGTVGTHAINASLFHKLPYDTMRDFAPVAFVGYTPTLHRRRRRLAGEVAEGPGGARGPAAGAHLRVGRQRHLGPSRRRAAGATPGRQDDPRAVQGRRDGDDRA